MTRSPPSTGCGRRRRRVLDVVGTAAGDVLRRHEGVDRGGRRARSPPSSGSTSKAWRRGPPATRSSCASCASRWPTSTAARCRRAGRAGCSSSSGSPSRWSFPQALDAGNLASKFDVIIFPSGVGPAPAGGRGGAAAAAVAAAGVAAVPRRQISRRNIRASSGHTRRRRRPLSSRSSSKTAAPCSRSGDRR